MFLDLFVWWYSRGWQKAWRDIPANLKKVQQTFTLPVLLDTLFSPWKQITSGGGRSLDEKFRAMIDNLVSRTVGFFVRFGVLICALIGLAITFVLSLAIAVAWPAIPVAIIYCLFRGIAG